MTTAWRPLLDGDDAALVTDAARRIFAALGPPIDAPASLGHGLPGLALALGQGALALGDAALRDRCEAALASAMDLAATEDLPPGLYAGFTGVAFALAYLGPRLFAAPPDAGDAGEDPLDDVDARLAHALRHAPWPECHDLIGGAVGVGLYALARRTRPSARACVDAVIDLLAANARARPEGLAWWTPPGHTFGSEDPEGSYNLGVAHGLPGVIAFGAAARLAGVRAAALDDLLAGAVRFLLAAELAADAPSAFPTWIVPGLATVPSRLAWCYGDAGIAAALHLAATAAGDPSWRAAATRVAVRAAERSFESSRVADAGLCHGSAGIAHIFNRLFQATGDERLAAAARRWLGNTLARREPGAPLGGFRTFRTPPGQPLAAQAWLDDPGFLYGAAGVALALLATTSDVEPAWDAALGLSVPGPAPPGTVPGLATPDAGGAARTV